MRSLCLNRFYRLPRSCLTGGGGAVGLHLKDREQSSEDASVHILDRDDRLEWKTLWSRAFLCNADLTVMYLAPSASIKDVKDSPASRWYWRHSLSLQTVWKRLSGRINFKAVVIRLSSGYYIINVYTAHHLRQLFLHDSKPRVFHDVHIWVYVEFHVAWLMRVLDEKGPTGDKGFPPVMMHFNHPGQ